MLYILWRITEIAAIVKCVANWRFLRYSWNRTLKVITKGEKKKKNITGSGEEQLKLEAGARRIYIITTAS